MASAGRILIMPKGNYDSSVTYEMLDMVHYNGTSWLAKKTVSNIEPSTDNSEHWHCMLNFDPSEYLPTAGGTLKGRVFLGNGSGSLGSSADGTYIESRTDNSNYRGIVIDSQSLKDDVSSSLKFVDSVNNNSHEYKIFGEHNKKYGSYVGNGSELERIVRTDSIGEFMMVWSNQGMGFISPVGAFFSTGEGQFVYIDSTSCHYSGGLLTLRTNHALINGEGNTYNYQCL